LSWDNDTDKMNKLEKDRMLHAIDELAEQIPNGHIIAAISISDLLLTASHIIKRLRKENKMGVMPCERKGCENILCNRIINVPKQTYICNSCFYELTEVRQTWDPNLTLGEVIKKVVEFMNTPPGNNVKNTEANFNKIINDE